MLKRLPQGFVIALFTLFVLIARPAPARADLTAFWGVTPTDTTRSVRGVSIGAGTPYIDGEFEWSKTREELLAPGLTTYSFNGMIGNAGRVRVYLLAGLGR